MAYEKTWQFDTNRAVAGTTVTDTGQYVLWYYKAFLCGHIGGATKGLWTVVGSSDAVTGAMDGLDRWGTSFNASKIVRSNSGGVGRSWVVLQSPPHAERGTRIYVMLAYDSSVDSSIGIQMSVAPPTGGSATAKPTFAINMATTNAVGFIQTTNFGAFHLNAGLATDGSFFVFQSRDNTSVISSCFMGSWLANAKSYDQYPFLLHLNQNNTGWGTSSTYDIQNTTYTWMPSPDGSNTAVYSWAAILPLSSNLPVGPDPWDSSYLDYPIFIGSSAAAIRSIRGRLQDIAYFPGTANTGTVDSTPGAPTYMVAGYYWFPTNAAPSL